MAGNGTAEKKSNTLIWLVMLVFIVGGGWIAYKLFYKPPATLGPDSAANANNDPLCESVRTKQLQCVVGLASENVLGPGHFVARSPGANTREKVPFPDGDLFSRDCIVPGEQVDSLLESLKRQEPENTVAFEAITYKLIGPSKRVQTFPSRDSMT
jgi:hypothetical protein